MKCVFLLFDSLNRHALSCYADDTIPTPNFARLAARSTVFERHFVGSLPCMPARRDIQTGRLNFLHRGWGPLEPFDHSLAAILRDSGIATHLITDHYHYFEDGGAGFHGRYSSWEFIRGQEKDKWRPPLAPAPDRWAARFDERQHDFSPDINSKLPYYINRDHLEATGAYPLPPPALGTRMSMAPKWSTVPCTIASQSARTFTSPAMKCSRSPASSSSSER